MWTLQAQVSCFYIMIFNGTYSVNVECITYFAGGGGQREKSNFQRRTVPFIVSSDGHLAVLLDLVVMSEREF